MALLSDDVKIQIVESLAEPVGKLWRDRQRLQVAANRSFNIALPLSSTPLPVFEWVVEHAGSFDGWSHVNFVLMDEQLDGSGNALSYVPVEDPASYEGFAQRHLLKPLLQRTNVDAPVLKPPIEELGTADIRIDLLVLALGVEGNYANVMPGTPVETGWHVADLLPAFRQAHTSPDSGSYAGATFRDKGMSLGPQQVIGSEEVVVIVSGVTKRPLVEELLSSAEVRPGFPLSIIHHPEVSSKCQLVLTSC